MTTHRLDPPIALGQSDFRRLRTEGAYYVDKSLFIQDVIECSYQTMLLPRPRRFGKTLNLSVLRYFFEKTEEDRQVLFDYMRSKGSPKLKHGFGWRL